MTKSEEKYFKIVCPSNKHEAGDGWGNNLLMQRDGAFIGWIYIWFWYLKRYQRLKRINK